MNMKQNRKTIRHAAGHPARSMAALALTALSALLAVPAAQAAITLDPLMAGQFAAGTGANASFLRIDGNWTGTSVYWKEIEPGVGEYSNSPGAGFQRIGEYGWGTGIWGLADWAAINAAGSTLPVQSWSGVVATIDHSDAEYASAGYSGWGTVGALPGALFAGTSGPQDNWTSHYTGYLRITDPGSYNFGVLYDDGFFLRIWGADATPLEISSDFLSARDRLGFDEDLLLGTGLYRFELGTYDRLEVGVVNLAWRQGDGEWLTVPTEHLVNDPRPVPVPATAGVLAIGAVALAAATRRQRNRQA